MKYSKEIIEEISGYLEEGASAKDACDLAGISEETFYAWKKEKPEFSESVTKGKLKFKIGLIKTINEAGRKTWQASAWILEHRYPKEFSLKHLDNTEYEETNKDELTPEQREMVDRFLNHEKEIRSALRSIDEIMTVEQRGLAQRHRFVLEAELANKA